MEITEGTLRTLVAQVDDQHRSGMDSMQDQIKELHAHTRLLRRLTQRSMLKRVGATTAAVAIGSQFVPLSSLIPAYAAGDGDIAAFAETVELTAVAAYTAAAKSGLITTKAVLDAAVKFSGHHTEHAAAFGSAAGSAATGKLNQKLLDALAPSLGAAKTEADVIKIAFDLENAAAATYLFALGALTSKAALQLTASILPVEAQHAVVLGSVLGVDAASYLPSFESETAFVDPAKFPVA